MTSPSSYETDDDLGLGWKGFAGIMLILAGSINIIQGLVAITNASFYRNLAAGTNVTAARDEHDLDVGLGHLHLGLHRGVGGLLRVHRSHVGEDHRDHGGARSTWCSSSASWPRSRSGRS